MLYVARQKPHQGTDEQLLIIITIKIEKIYMPQKMNLRNRIRNGISGALCFLNLFTVNSEIFN